MSSSRNATRNSNTNSSFGTTFHKGGKKPFCKVCFDAKKPQAVYESHFVKDREGKVTCVTLLEQECRYCFKTGHTVKFCPAVAANNASKEKAENQRRRQQEAEERHKRQEQSNAAAAAKAKMNSTGRYAALFCDDDSDDEQEAKPQVKPVEEFPALGKPSQFVASATMNFASAIKKDRIQVEKQREQEENQKIQEAGFTVLSRNTNGTTKKLEPTKMPSSIPASVQPIYCSSSKGKSWIDSDSEDEDDEQYFAPNVTLNRSVSCYQPEQEYVDNSDW